MRKESRLNLLYRRRNVFNNRRFFLRIEQPNSNRDIFWIRVNIAILIVATFLSAIAVGVAFWQTYLLKGQLTAAERNRSAESLIVSMNDVCNLLAKFPVEVRALYVGDIVLPRLAARNDAQYFSLEIFADELESNIESFKASSDIAFIWHGRSQALEDANHFLDVTLSHIRKRVQEDRMVRLRSGAISSEVCNKIRFSVMRQLAGSKVDSFSMTTNVDPLSFWVGGKCPVNVFGCSVPEPSPPDGWPPFQ